MTSMSEIPRLVEQLYGIVNKFSQLPNARDRKFTPDGHLVGSLGEVIAAYHYNLQLLPNSTPTHDAKTKGRNRKKIQIKLTQGTKVGLREKPEHLLVLHLNPSDGKVREVYNGPGDVIWNASGKRASASGQRQVSVSRLEKEQAQVPMKKRIRPVKGRELK